MINNQYNLRNINNNKFKSKISYVLQEPFLFDGINVYINNARSLGIVGDNGLGKTTLASILLGFHQPNSGTVELCVNGNYSPRIGYLDQFPERLIGARSLEDLLNDFVKGDILQPQLVQKIKNFVYLIQVN